MAVCCFTAHCTTIILLSILYCLFAFTHTLAVYFFLPKFLSVGGAAAATSVDECYILCSGDDAVDDALPFPFSFTWASIFHFACDMRT